MTDLEYTFCQQLAEKLDLWGERYWMATNDDGKSSCASTLDGECWRHEHLLREWLTKQQAKGYLTEYEIKESRVVPHFLTDANEDFRVLQKVRNDWPYDRSEHPIDQLSFLCFLCDLAIPRAAAANRDAIAFHYGRGWDPLFYEIGDYARAAMRVLAK